MPKPYLRYPGGKSRHTEKILRYVSDGVEYREPFLGGGSVYLAGKFKNAWINDLDYGIYDMWRMVKEEPEVLIEWIEKHTPILEHGGDPASIDEAIALWRRIQDDKEDVPAGYRALFLVKTCFNGVQSGGPTGGVKQQSKYTLTARWAKNLTVNRIRACHKYMRCTKVTNLSWQELVTADGENVFLFCDPPYLVKGRQCYDLAFTENDHRELAEKLTSSPHRYVVTLDDCKEIRDIWSNCVPKQCMIAREWQYSMTENRTKNKVGKELFVVDPISWSEWKQKQRPQKTKRMIDELL
jgi:DNA adenine methylase